MACINPNTPEFKAALERAGGNPMLAEIELSKSLEVKPGVEELFDSNPELANAVYEATIPNRLSEVYKLTNTPIGDPVSQTEGTGLCDGTCGIMAYRLKTQGMPYGTTQIDDKYANYHAIALTEIEGKRFILNQPQLEFMSREYQKAPVWERAQYWRGDDIRMNRHLAELNQFIYGMEIPLFNFFTGKSFESEYGEIGPVFKDITKTEKIEDVINQGSGKTEKRTIVYQTAKLISNPKVLVKWAYDKEFPYEEGLTDFSSSLDGEEIIAWSNDVMKPRLIEATEENLIQEYKLTKEQAKESIKKINSAKIEKGNENNKIITPQQKQQAIQLYSQYVEQTGKQDIEGFKEFVSGKSDIQYQLTSQEIKEADKKLDAKLLNFLSKYGIQSKEINNFKEKWGVDALGATDVLNKIIYHSVEKKLDTIPEEAAHMVVMLMGQTHPLIRDLMDNIKDWSGYQAVYDEYMPIYNNEKQVKVEALGKLVTESLLQKWTGKTKEERNLLQKILEAVSEFLNNLTKPFVIKEGSYFKDAADKIAVNVLNENEAFIGSPTSKIEKLNYEQAVAGNKLAKNIIDIYSGKKFRFKLVGSLAIAGQGEDIFRPSKTPIHDLDFIVNNDDLETGLEKYNRLVDYMNQINAVPIHGGWENKQKTYTTYAYLIPKEGYKFSNIERNNRDNLYKYTILDENDNIVANVKLVSPKVTVFTDKNDKVLTDEKINSLSQLHIPVDFFVYNVDSKEQYKDIFSSIQDIYFGKLSLSPHGADERMFQREKDQEDYRTSNFKNRNIEKNEFLYFQLKKQSTEKLSDKVIKPIGEESNLQYQFKVVSNLYNNLDKINKLWKQIGNNNTFWNKIQQDFQIPKDQINLLKESEGNTIEEKLTSFAANYSYTVKINTGKAKSEELDFYEGFTPENTTQYYSSLTVPGGTNYTENEIATPAITPSIKGHAQFATDNGIGWFRSDDKISEQKKEFSDLLNKNRIEDAEKLDELRKTKDLPTKTRRILEVQSDLFQKGRDKQLLIPINEKVALDHMMGNTSQEMKELLNSNSFLQLLNKDNNWVTFFVKSIVQDSAKKGYKKVLFPSGNTASKVEGHTTLEEFKKQKEDRIKLLEEGINERLIEAEKKDKNEQDLRKKGSAIKSAEWINRTAVNEITRLKQELERVEKEGFGALKPIFNFYENTVKNVLNKQYGKENVKQVTDEYGNTWNEIEIKEENKQEIYLQQEEQSTEKPSENIDNKIKSFLASIGVNIKIVQDLTDSKGNKLSGIAVADMLNKIIQVVDGKADITTLPEEAAHFFVEMLGESNPLYKQMFDKITSYKIYSETVDQYRNNKAYKNADGTLNINKLKKEAIGKLIMTHIIKNETNNENKDKINSAKSWWSKLLEWIKNVFKQTSTNPFAEAAQKIINNDISDLNLDVESNETYFQLEAQSGIEKVIKDQNVIKLDESINPKTGEKKHTYTENGKDIIDKNGNPRSVTNNVVDPWYKNRFPTDSRTTIRKTIDEFSAEKGTDIHADLESILRRFVDKNGDIKATPSPISKIKTNDVIYAKLEQYVMSLLNEFKGKPGTKFLAEVRLYNRKRNLPGTIDLLIMEPDGTTHIYDWKSQQINKDQTELKWFKPLAYRIQLGEYKKILMEEYGIYKFGKIRAIPIATKYTIANVNGKLTPTGLKDIEMEYDIKNIPTDKNYLLPVVMLDESTNDPKLDSLIAKLNAVYEKISIGDVQESEKAFKHDELNILKKAINDLHIRKDMTVFIENGLYEINKYSRKIKDNTFGLKDIKDSLLILNVYAEGSVYLEKLFVDIKNQLKTETNPDIKEYLQNLQEDFLKMSQNAKALLIDIKGIPGEKNPSGVMARLGNEFAQEEGITTLLNPEVQMDFWKRNFRSLTTLSTAAMNTFAKILRRVQAQRNIKIKDLNSKLQTLRKEHEEWARKKGLTGENIFNPILEIDSKGNWNGDFVRIYSAEYFKLRDEALKNEDVNWIKLNTDFDNDGYKKDLENFKNNVEERYPEKNEKTESRKQNLIERWVERHSPDSKVAYLNKKNFYIKPKAKWQSEKYKTIYAKDSSGKYINEPLKNTYEFFQELIKYSSKIGMLDRYSSRFIPGVYQSAITNIIGSSFKNIYDIQSKFESLVVDSEGGFGNIDPLTGVLKKQMKVYFKKDLGVQNEDGTFDYSNKSKDLFSVFSIWGQQMYNYESMDSIRDKSDILLEIEKIKPRLETNMWSVVKDDKTTIAENSVNAGILEDYINYYIYGEIKGSDVDKAVTINGKDYSLKQATQKVIKAATFKTLALNLLSGTATFVGGTGNAFFQASKKLIFTEKDWIQGTADFTSNNEVTSLGIDFFDLGLDDREKNDVRNLSTSWKKRNMKWDHLLFMQHYGDKWATYPVAAAMLRTFMFDGKNIVSIRDFVKKQNDYDNFYKLPEGERKRVQKKIDKEIEELQNTKSLKAVGKVENGKFSIPGLEQGSDAAINFRAVVQKTLKGVIGNATRDDMTTLRMGLIGQVLMQFRSWMPQMMAERFGDMTYDVDLETWQYGKARLFVQHLVDGRILPLVKEMIFGFGNNTIEKAKEKYKEFVVKLLAEGKITSEKEFMTEAEFVDMYMGNVRSMMREILLLASFMFLLFLGAGDDDDDEDVSGFKKYAIKALQKYQNEFSFYYSPTEFTKMLKNPVPLIGVLEDFERFLTQGIGQVYNFGIGDEEGMEKNKPAKYLFKLLPITKEGLNFYALYDDEFRKEWAIR